MIFFLKINLDPFNFLTKIITKSYCILYRQNFMELKAYLSTWIAMGSSQLIEMMGNNKDFTFGIRPPSDVGDVGNEGVVI